MTPIQPSQYRNSTFIDSTLERTMDAFHLDSGNETLQAIVKELAWIENRYWKGNNDGFIADGDFETAGRMLINFVLGGRQGGLEDSRVARAALPAMGYAVDTPSERRAVKIQLADLTGTPAAWAELASPRIKPSPSYNSGPQGAGRSGDNVTTVFGGTDFGPVDGPLKRDDRLPDPSGELYGRRNGQAVYSDQRDGPSHPATISGTDGTGRDARYWDV